MISLEMTGKCAACPAIAPRISLLYAEDAAAEAFVTCENEQLCEHLERYITKNLTAMKPQKLERPET